MEMVVEMKRRGQNKKFIVGKISKIWSLIGFRKLVKKLIRG